MDVVNQIVNAFEMTWTWATLAAAILAGIGIGYVLFGSLALDPTYMNPALTARSVGRLIAGTSIAAGLVFYVGQTVASAVGADPGWSRVIGRLGLWLVYSVFLGIGAWWRIHDHVRILRSQARDRAQREIEDDSK